MSAARPDPLPTPGGLSPLSSGPIPLSVPAAVLWALGILSGTLFFGFGLPVLASRIAEVTVPPGAIVFGYASVIPAQGWTQTSATASSVTLDNNGVWITFRSVSAQGESAAARAVGLSDQMRLTYPQLTVASDPSPFWTPTQSQGQLIALAGTSQTAIVASVVEAGQAVDVESLGESTQFGEAVADIESMMESIRILESGDG